MIKSNKLQSALLTLNILISQLSIFILPAFSQNNHSISDVYVQNNRAVPLLDDSAILTAQAEHAIKLEVSVTAKVKKLLPEDVKGLPHQRF